ncbi:prepilin-type N-terminal cleavage/methylation domain-containing protein [bacterium]|nr:prepilin-type N-terminal cleavage/methylation domain-containing protein [bacterium]
MRKGKGWVKGNRWRSGRRGFTLVELVIVGALIALFSSLAVFGVQQQFRSNLRKATIGETRQISQSLDFANLDTSLFPKLCWLTEGDQGMQLLGNQLGSVSAFYSRADIYGRRPTTSATAIVSFGSGIQEQWNGPYFALSQSRAGIAQGRGGFVYMLFPDLPTTGANNPGDPSAGGYRWPADPYNSPYMVYMLDLDLSSSTPQIQFVTEDSLSFTRKGNYVNAVVSYGPNQFPGGSDEFAKPPFAAGGGPGYTQTGGSPWDRRLYIGRPGFTDRGVITFTYLTFDEFNGAAGRRKAAAWSNDFDTTIGTGISDLGSDDIVFEF